MYSQRCIIAGTLVACSVCVAVERRFPHDTAGRMLEEALLESSRLGKSESTLKGIISAATMAVDVGLADVNIGT